MSRIGLHPTGSAGDYSGGGAAVVALCLASLLLVLSCGPKPETTSIPSLPDQRPAPSGVVAVAGDHSIDIRWNPNQPEDRIISGYNIYIAEPESPFERANQLPYAGDTEFDLDVETYPATDLSNGLEYRVTIATVYPDGAEVFALDSASAIPRPEGRFRLEESFSGSNSGFSFARQVNVVTDDLSNDLYLTVIRGKLMLASPRRIDDVLRVSKFSSVRKLKSAPLLYDRRDLTENSELAPISPGTVLIVETADGCFALVEIENIGSDLTYADIHYIYQTRPNTLRF